MAMTSARLILKPNIQYHWYWLSGAEYQYSWEALKRFDMYCVVPTLIMWFLNVRMHMVALFFAHTVVYVWLQDCSSLNVPDLLMQMKQACRYVLFWTRIVTCIWLSGVHFYVSSGQVEEVWWCFLYLLEKLEDSSTSSSLGVEVLEEKREYIVPISLSLPVGMYMVFMLRYHMTFHPDHQSYNSDFSLELLA